MKLLLFTVIALMPKVVWASSYADPVESFFSYMAMGFGVSLGVYIFLSIVLILFNNFYDLYKVPVFIVLMASAVVTLGEVALISIIGGFPGGVFIGSLMSTVIYIYLVKYNRRLDKE